MSWDELASVRRLLRQAPWRVAERRTRRLRADRRGTVELRRTMRSAARQGGDAPQLARASARKQAPPDRHPLRRQRLDGPVLAAPAGLRARDRPARARRDLRVFDTPDQNHASAPPWRHRLRARPCRRARCTTSAAGRASPTRCTRFSACTRGACSDTARSCSSSATAGTAATPISSAARWPGYAAAATG